MPSYSRLYHTSIFLANRLSHSAPTLTATSMTPALLTAVDSTSHVHLIVGCNSTAGARCNKSLEVGAKPIIVAPNNGDIHYGLTKRIEESKIQWSTLR